MKTTTVQSEVSFNDIQLRRNFILLTYVDQTFGVDLEARARADRKRVPILVATVLTFLDNRKCGRPYQSLVC
jgi:hypothetical protein